MFETRPVPGTAFFKEAVIKALGILSQHQPGVLVPLKDVKALVRQLTGINPLIEKYGWPLEGRNWAKQGEKKKPIGVNRRISLAYQKWYFKRKIPLTLDFAATGKQGMWGLTDAGLDFAKELNGFQEKRNLTSEWFFTHLKPKTGGESELMVMMKAYLSSKMGISAKSGMVEDHIQNFFMRAIRRDSFRTRIEEGKRITYKRVCSYALNSCKNDIRDAGTNPVTRTLYGAKTDTDRKYEKNQVENPNLLSNPDKTAKVVTSYDEATGKVEGFAVVEEVSPETEASYQSLIRALRKALLVRFPSKGPIYADVLMDIAQGKSSKEIAETHSLSPGGTKKLIADARKAAQAVRAQFC